MSDTEFGRVAVLGAGTMGAGIAQICAAAGSRVALYDVEQRFVDAGLGRVREFLEKGVEKGKTKPAERDLVLSNLRGTPDLAAAVADADLVIEAIPERLDLKRQVFAAVARACAPTTVLASNTSSLSLAEIFAALAEPERCLGMHFFNPPPLMPLLEVVKAASTSDAWTSGT